MDYCASHNKNTKGTFVLQIWHDSSGVPVCRNSYLNRGSCELCQLFNMLALFSNNSTDSLSWNKEVDHLLFRSLLRRAEETCKIWRPLIQCDTVNQGVLKSWACQVQTYFLKVVWKNVTVCLLHLVSPNHPQSHWDMLTSAQAGGQALKVHTGLYGGKNNPFITQTNVEDVNPLICF